jgi:hypothetical protein
MIAYCKAGESRLDDAVRLRLQEAMIECDREAYRPLSAAYSWRAIGTRQMATMSIYQRRFCL